MSDVRVVFSVQSIRAFLYGFSSILIGTSLAASGLDRVAVGAIFTAMLLGMAIASLAVGRWGGSDRAQADVRWAACHHGTVRGRRTSRRHAIAS